MARNIARRLLSRLSDRGSHCSLFSNAVVEVWLILGMLKTARAARLCEASSLVACVFGRGSKLQLAYSSIGRISCLYALALSVVDWGGIVRLMKPNVLDALDVV